MSVSGRSRLLVALVVVGALAIGSAIVIVRPDPASDERELDPFSSACSLPAVLLERIARGHDPDHSEDVTMLPRLPNYSGTAEITSHSGPWNYLQKIPLVLYGPGVISSRGEARGAVTLADIYPTIGAALGVDLPGRDGHLLPGALAGEAATPRLVLVIVWDGVGTNVLQRWPDAWPTLDRLGRDGILYRDAIAGSSPSITPATHSTIGTGAFPRSHGVTAIEYRADDGTVRTAFQGRDPRDLEMTTFGDIVDGLYGNESVVGMLASKSWHLGMMGHGSATEGGDRDLLGLLSVNGAITGSSRFYRTPSYLKHLEGLEERARDLDRADGKVDGLWMDHEILGDDDNPAWTRFQTDAVIEFLDRELFGRDEVPDLFFTNYKMSDIVGHQYNMDSDEMEAVVRAQDEALGRIVDHLDRTVGDYMVVVTADHGHTPSATRTGAWPISNRELERDIDENFEVPDGESLVLANSAVGPFLDREVMDDLAVDTVDVARFILGYTVGENATGDLPETFRDREDEPVFEAAFPSNDVDRALECARRKADE